MLTPEASDLAEPEGAVAVGDQVGKEAEAEQDRVERGAEGLGPEVYMSDHIFD